MKACLVFSLLKNLLAHFTSITGLSCYLYCSAVVNFIRSW